MVVSFAVKVDTETDALSQLSALSVESVTFCLHGSIFTFVHLRDLYFSLISI
jgi:hypothetical protein